MAKNIFLVGPASVGKSTVGKLLAEELNYAFVDIDLIFCDRIDLIPDFINQNGYVAYCETNSKLVDQLIVEFPSDTVFATPSGFLVHDRSPKLIKKHLKLISGNAISVLLLPDSDSHKKTSLIVSRQVARYPEVDPVIESNRYIKRHRKYIKYGDIKVIGEYTPKEIVEKIKKNLS